MKIKVLVGLLFFVFQFSFSQTEKLIKGKVICDNFPVQGIEVINLVSEKSTVTNAYGAFSILAKAEDMLVFVSKNYDYKRLFLEQDVIDKNSFIILLTKKPEQLEEVVVRKNPKAPIISDIQALMDTKYTDDAQTSLKNPFIKDGTITNGADLIRIGEMIFRIFIKKKDIPITNVPKIEFKALAAASCTQDFFNKTLALKPNEIALFLDFCDADSKSKTLIENNNVLSLMDFLLAKNIEFKKLPAFENKDVEKLN